MVDEGLITALFDYVKPNDSVCSVEWTSAQYEELQLQVGECWTVDGSAKCRGVLVT